MTSKKLYTSNRLQRMMSFHIYKLQSFLSFFDNFSFLLLAFLLPKRAFQGQTYPTMEGIRVSRVFEIKGELKEARVCTNMFLI